MVPSLLMLDGARKFVFKSQIRLYIKPEKTKIRGLRAEGEKE